MGVCFTFSMNVKRFSVRVDPAVLTADQEDAARLISLRDGVPFLVAASRIVNEDLTRFMK